MRRCNACNRSIGDNESCWRDHAGRYFCNECNNKMRGKHDGQVLPSGVTDKKD